MRNALTFLLALAAVAAATVVLATLGRSDARADSQRRMQLRLTQAFDDFFGLDLGAEGPSLGDVFGGPVTLFRGGNSVGTLGFTCTQTRLVPQPEDLCVFSARFANGVLTAQTLFDESSTAPADWAITGGTGAYRDAGGFVLIEGDSVTLFIDNLGRADR